MDYFNDLSISELRDLAVNNNIKITRHTSRTKIIELLERIVTNKNDQVSINNQRKTDFPGDLKDIFRYELVQYLPYPEIVRLSFCNKTMAEILQNDNFYKYLIQRDYGDILYPELGNYKQQYMILNRINTNPEKYFDEIVRQTRDQSSDDYSDDYSERTITDSSKMAELLEKHIGKTNQETNDYSLIMKLNNVHDDRRYIIDEKVEELYESSFFDNNNIYVSDDSLSYFVDHITSLPRNEIAKFIKSPETTIQTNIDNYFSGEYLLQNEGFWRYALYELQDKYPDFPNF